MPVIEFETLVRSPIERCFDLNLDVDLHAAAFANTGERAVAGVTHGRLGPGDTVTWEAVHLGLRQRLTTRITLYDRPHRFQDEQLSGAFHRFRHLHTFASVPGGTLMADRFDYESPLGLVGHMADRLFLRRYVERLLHQRAEAIRQACEA